jgi:hypothetical protein
MKRNKSDYKIRDTDMSIADFGFRIGDFNWDADERR